MPKRKSTPSRVAARKRAEGGTVGSALVSPEEHWAPLATAGFGAAAGQSTNALANLGQGLQTGVGMTRILKDLARELIL